MSYPHLIQFETLDRRRRRAVGSADVPSRAAVVRAHARRGVARLRRLGRAPQCASGEI
jgi:hypothetical protein